MSQTERSAVSAALLQFAPAGLLLQPEVPPAAAEWLQLLLVHTGTVPGVPSEAIPSVKMIGRSPLLEERFFPQYGASLRVGGSMRAWFKCRMNWRLPPDPLGNPPS